MFAEDSKRAPSNLAGSLVRGALWSIGLRWGLRALGLASTLVIARLLTPADYGLVAMAMLVMGLVETFLDADASTALLRSANTDPDFIDSAWTLKFIQSLVVASAIAVAAPFAARYFEEQRLTAILWTYCLVTVGAGVSSVGPLLARRNLDWLCEVKTALIGRLSGFVATVGLAVLYRNYWALVIGGIIGTLAGLVAGYAVHPYRPRFKTTHMRELFGFSQWMLVSGVGLFFARKLDGFVVGRVGSAASMGAYNVALELGQMITMELGAPLNRALLPVLSNLHDDPARMRSALTKTLAAVNTVTLPAGIGLAMVAPEAVPTLLGAQWSEAVPLLAIFSVIGAIRFMTGPYYTLLMTLGHSRALAFMSWIELFVFAVSIAIFWSGNIFGIAEARVVSTLFIGAVWLAVGVRFGLTTSAFMGAVIRPFGATMLMALVLWALPKTGAAHAVELVYEIVLGGAVYLVSLGFSWYLAGCPDGLERMALEKLRALGVRTRRVFT